MQYLSFSFKGYFVGVQVNRGDDRVHRLITTTSANFKLVIYDNQDFLLTLMKLLLSFFVVVCACHGKSGNRKHSLDFPCFLDGC